MKATNSVAHYTREFQWKFLIEDYGKNKKDERKINFSKFTRLLSQKHITLSSA